MKMPPINATLQWFDNGIMSEFFIITVSITMAMSMPVMAMGAICIWLIFKNVFTKCDIETQGTIIVVYRCKPRNNKRPKSDRKCKQPET